MLSRRRGPAHLPDARHRPDHSRDIDADYHRDLPIFVEHDVCNRDD